MWLGRNVLESIITVSLFWGLWPWEAACVAEEMLLLGLSMYLAGEELGLKETYWKTLPVKARLEEGHISLKSVTGKLIESCLWTCE